MGIVEKIKEIEAEMARTQKNKATEHHLGLLKARIAKLRTQVRVVMRYINGLHLALSSLSLLASLAKEKVLTLLAMAMLGSH